MWQIEPETDSRRPISRLSIAAVGILATLALWLHLGQPYVGYYHAANTGVFISTPESCVDYGVEFIGTPGFFTDLGC